MPLHGGEKIRSRAMSRRVRCVISPAILVALIVVAGVRVASVARPPAGGPAPLPPTVRALDRLPLAFEANQGQTDPRVRFIARGRGYSLFLAQDESILVLQEPARGDRHARVRYANLYPGIDLQFHGSQGLLEYDLVVAPGADPAKVRIGFEGTGITSCDAACPGLGTGTSGASGETRRR
jgi:hypothetical protein